MTVRDAQGVINRAYNAPAHVLAPSEWEALEKLNNAIDGNPPAQSVAGDDAQFLEGILARSTGWVEDEDL